MNNKIQAIRKGGSSAIWLRYLDSLVITIGIGFLFIAGLYLIVAWNMRWGTGNLLIPAADDWGDVYAFAQYLQHKPFLSLLLVANQGHPQILIKLVNFLYYQLGFTHYKSILTINIFLHLIPVAIYCFMLWKDEFLAKPIKLVLTATPFIFMFDINWLVFLRVTQGYVWAFGYLFAFLALLCSTYVEKAVRKQLYLIGITILAFISCQFFVAAFTLWPSLFYFGYISRWSWKNYVILSLGMIISIVMYIKMQQNGHDFASNARMIFDYPLNFIKYLLLMFGENGITNYYGSNFTSYTNYLVSGITFSLCALLIAKNTFYRPANVLQRFIVTLLLFCFLVICGVAFGRLEKNFEASPFHYTPCVLNLYLPLITLIAIEIQRYAGKHFSQIITTSILIYFLITVPTLVAIVTNTDSFMLPSNGPNYERFSLMISSLVGTPSFDNVPLETPLILPSINILAMKKYGFANDPNLVYRGKKIGKDIPKVMGASKQITCSGDLIGETNYMFSHWPLLELRGWAWNNVDNKIPQLVLLTDDNNIILNTAPGEMTRVLKQTDAYSTWVAYLPYEKIATAHMQQLKLWVLTNQNQACYIKTFAVDKLKKQASNKALNILALQQGHIIP